MDKYKGLVDELRRWGGEDMGENLFDRAADAIEELLNVSEKPTGWIPVSERLPDEDIEIYGGWNISQEVLVTIVNHENNDDLFTDMSRTRNGKWQTCRTSTGFYTLPEWCEVVAWRPAIEPYKGEE